MKKIVTVILIILVSIVISFGQAPLSINYQAVARDTTGAILTSQDISVRITIFKDSIGGTAVYQETHSVEVNSYGLINLAIGTGTVISGIFSQIGWDTSEHYLKVEIDPDAGSNYFDFGATQLISVPYALESKHSSSLTLTGDNGNRYKISVDSSGNVVAEWLCGNSLVDIRDGKVYTTVLVGNQCWMAENLNVGTKINNIPFELSYQQTDNDTIEKYCYNNETDSCAIYGGLYEWTEAMQYDTVQGSRGICPEGWHIPADNEWKILEGTVDSQYPVGDTVWDNEGWRGFDAGGNLKSTGTIDGGDGLWYGPNQGATNSSGFTCLPGGFRFYFGVFDAQSVGGDFWVSSQCDTASALIRMLSSYGADVGRDIIFKSYGLSVRCLKND
jgi:uncharacterized protein (TIGR02145 family)